MFKKIIFIVLGLFGLLLTFGSSGAFQSTITQRSGGETITLAYVNWDSEVASTNVIAEVLREEGFTVNLVPLDNAIMWNAVATGEADAMVSAWLPSTHATQYEQYKDQIVDLGPNLEGAKTGLVVPAYMTDVNSISDLTNQANQEITAIEPGAGITAAAEKALETYPNLNNWTVLTSSTGAMTTALDQAIQNNKEIVITGWSPHWMFAKYDLKYLEDPRDVFGEGESIHTIVRKGFQEDHARAAQILSQFHWTVDDMEKVMLAINNGENEEQAAKDWINENPDKVNQWIAE